MDNDCELLQTYVNTGSDQAFSQIVERHIRLVYSVAMRQVAPDTHLAEDIVQAVFSDLARKARWLSPGISLIGWLHRATFYAACQARRTEQRRKRRESFAAESAMTPSNPPPDWEIIRAKLDEELNQLGPKDRLVLLMRFFEEKSLKEIALVMGCGESGVSRRVSRALKLLRTRLARHGVVATVEGLAAGLAAHASVSVPLGLSGSMAASALATAAVSKVSLLTGLKIIALSHSQQVAVGLIAVALIGTPFWLQEQRLGRLQRENQALSRSTLVSELRSENEALSNRLARFGQTVASADRSPVLRRPPWHEVESADYRQYIANMRQLGVPDDTIRDIVLADLDDYYSRQRRTILASAVRDEFWRTDGMAVELGKEQIDLLLGLAREKESAIRELIGLETDQTKSFLPDARDIDLRIDGAFRFLSEEKLGQLEQLVIQKEREKAEGGSREAELDAERFETELRALFSEQEFEEYRLRSSPLASRLREDLQEFEPNEAEFRAIFKVASGLGEEDSAKARVPQGPLPAKNAIRRMLSRPELREQLRQTLGAERLRALEDNVGLGLTKEAQDG